MVLYNDVTSLSYTIHSVTSSAKLQRCQSNNVLRTDYLLLEFSKLT